MLHILQALIDLGQCAAIIWLAIAARKLSKIFFIQYEYNKNVNDLLGSIFLKEEKDKKPEAQA